MSDETPFKALSWLSGVLSEKCTLDAPQRLVALTVARHANSNGVAWPGFGTLERETGLGRTKIVTSIAELKRRGLLTRATPAEALATYGSAEGAPAELQKYFAIPAERRPNLYTLPLVPPLAALALPAEKTELQKGATTRTSAPRELVRLADGRGAPAELGGVHQADGRGPPGAPKLLRELPNVTAQATGEALVAPATTSMPLKLEVLKPPRKRSEQSRSVRWKRVPETWHPTTSHRELAAELGVNFDLEVAKFRDHDYRVTKTDADAAFRTWLRNARTFAPRAGGFKAGPPRQMGVRSEAEAQSYGADRAQKILERSAQRAAGA